MTAAATSPASPPPVIDAAALDAMFGEMASVKTAKLVADDPIDLTIASFQYRLTLGRKQVDDFEWIRKDQQVFYSQLVGQQRAGWKYVVGLAREAERKNCPVLRGKAEAARRAYWSDTSAFGLNRILTELRNIEGENFGKYPTNLQRWTINKSSLALKSFVERLKERKGASGPPRFKPIERFRSFGFREFTGVILEDGDSRREKLLRFKGVTGKVRVRMHRPLPEGATFCAAVFTRVKHGVWDVTFQIRATPEAFAAAKEAAKTWKKDAKKKKAGSQPKAKRKNREAKAATRRQPQPKTFGPQKGSTPKPKAIVFPKFPKDIVVRKPVGMDWGVNTLAFFSDGFRVANPRIWQAHRQRIEALQQQLARRKPGSRRRRKIRNALTAAYLALADVRDNFSHHLSAAIVARYPLLAIEDLRIRNMTRSARGTVDNPGKNVSQKAGLNREILDTAPGALITRIRYKAARAGGEMRKVDPRGTSTRCSDCSERVPKKLSVRVHVCPRCELRIDRDLNGARNICDRGWPRLAA